MVFILRGDGPVDLDRVENDALPHFFAAAETVQETVQVEIVVVNEWLYVRGVEVFDSGVECFLADPFLSGAEQQQVECPCLWGRLEPDSPSSAAREGEMEAPVQADLAVHLGFGTEIVEKDAVVALVGEKI